MPVLANIDPLKWESDFFGLQSGKIIFAADAPLLTVERCAVWPRLQAKVSATETGILDSLQQLGFRLVEGEADFMLAIAPGDRLKTTVQVATPVLIPALREMAGEVFRASRFRAPWYPRNASSRFYQQWVENAVLGRFDDQCLVVIERDVLQGFVTLRQLTDDSARIGLLAGRGLGDDLMAAARGWCLARGLTRLWVATQLGNRAAIRRYQLSGATLMNTAYWLYR